MSLHSIFRWVTLSITFTFLWSMTGLGSAQTASGLTAAGETATPLPTWDPYYGTGTNTPGPDGKIVHIVQPGESLNSIAAAYGLTLQELKGLNPRIGDVIYPNDELLIRPAFTVTPTTEATSTPTQLAATSTRRPTRTPTPQSTAEFTRAPATQAAPTATQTGSTGIMQADSLGAVLVSAIVLLAMVGAGLVVAGMLLKRRN